ncbi:Hypothetical protein CINCED_3A014709 [Cinara cedri]|uniref:Myb/SANT-like DNA-binding domain-containing protein n=1 Tax=Cinara cedri TaxID=506608 RepID=A0A5E4M7A8_9HEMI|nr:Hypothetical protein CINCED_3A014709 [Cinara cedri]
MAMRFKSIFLDPQTSQPTYNNKNEVLCEVLLEDRSTALAYVPAATIRSIGIILPKRIRPKPQVPDNSQDLQNRSDNKSPSPEIIEIIEEFASDNNTDYIWSPYRSTPDDHKATKKFIEILSNETYAEKLKDKITPKFKIWQQISNEMKNAGFPVAENEKEGGKKCDQKWRNLENKYALYNASSKNGQLARKKPPYYDMIYAIKNKNFKKSIRTLAEENQNRTSPINHQNCETVVLSNEHCPVNQQICETVVLSNEQSPVNQQNCETVVLSNEQSPVNQQNCETVILSDEQSPVNQQNCETVVLSSEQTNNTHCEPKTSSNSKDSALSPSELLQRITVHHEEILDMQKRHFEEMKANLKKQDDQREEMLRMFASLVEESKRKRKRSESD